MTEPIHLIMYVPKEENSPPSYYLKERDNTGGITQIQVDGPTFVNEHILYPINKIFKHIIIDVIPIKSLPESY
jgi:hypothetical protein